MSLNISYHSAYLWKDDYFHEFARWKVFVIEKNQPVTDMVTEQIRKHMISILT